MKENKKTISKLSFYLAKHLFTCCQQEPMMISRCQRILQFTPHKIHTQYIRISSGVFSMFSLYLTAPKQNYLSERCGIIPPPRRLKTRTVACPRLSVSEGLNKTGRRQLGSGREIGEIRGEIRGEITPSPFLSRIPLIARSLFRSPPLTESLEQATRTAELASVIVLSDIRQGRLE